MSDNEDYGVEAPFTITLKGGSGYDKPWLVLRAQTAEEAVGLLGEAQATELLDRIAEYSAEFQVKTGGGVEKAPAGNSSRGSGTPSRSAGPSARGGAARPASSDVEYHPEGLKCPKDDAPVIYKKITTKAGKSFELWVCENQREKGDGHHSEFIN